eukprot:1084480-Amphidinium_carterae.2
MPLTCCASAFIHSYSHAETYLSPFGVRSDSPVGSLYLSSDTHPTILKTAANPHAIYFYNQLQKHHGLKLCNCTVHRTICAWLVDGRGSIPQGSRKRAPKSKLARAAREVSDAPGSSPKVG